MPEKEYKPWKVSRLNRLMQILELKARGLNNEEVAAKMPISLATVSRELNSPQAHELGRRMTGQTTNLISSLVERQISQIETLPPKNAVSQLIQRGRLINTLSGLVPRQVEQKISGELSAEVKMLEFTEEDLLTVVAPVVRELMAREARGADSAEPEEDLEESVG